jgi:hypothetical protein
MRRGLLTGGVLALVCAAAVLPAASVSAQPARTASASPGVVKYELTFTGLMFIKQTDSGMAPNAGDCHLSPDDGHAPFSSQYSLKLAWTSQFKFGFQPSGRHNGQVAARSSNVHGSHFSYSGSSYGDGCHQVSYGPGGKVCTGTLRNQGKGLLFAQFSKAHANEDMRFLVEPFGALVATPPSCNNDDSPPAPVTAEDAMTLSSLGTLFTAHAYSTVELIARGVNKTIPFKLDKHKDCSQPGSDPGDTDHCTLTITGNGFLDIHPLG